jgi:hypothetical protein
MRPILPVVRRPHSHIDPDWLPAVERTGEAGVSESLVRIHDNPKDDGQIVTGPRRSQDREGDWANRVPQLVRRRLF